MSGCNKLICILWNPTGGYSKNFFLPDMLKLRFVSVRFKGCLVAPRRSSCSSMSVICQRDGCLAFTNSDHSLAHKSDTEVYTNVTFNTVMSGEICYEKVAARCRRVLQRCIQQKFLDSTLFDLKQSLQDSKIDAFLIRKIRPAHAVSSPRLLFINLMRAELTIYGRILWAKNSLVLLIPTV